MQRIVPTGGAEPPSRAGISSLCECRELLDLARLLLTPGAKMSDADDGRPRSTVEWEKARIRWHRLDGNDALADEMLTEKNAVLRAMSQPEIEV